MGSRGASSGSGSKVARRPAVEKTVNQIIKRTANLKNEQYRIIDEDGNVILEKKGDKHSVGASVGEKRNAMWMDDKEKTTIHNHPNGGTFSSSDFDDFGFGAKEVIAATPEGTYSLVNKNFGKKNAKEGWTKLRDATRKIDEVESNKSSLVNLKKAQDTVRNSRVGRELRATTDKWVKRRNEGASSAELQKLVDKSNKLQEQYSKAVQKEKRRLETQPYHDFYKKNAKKYGFEYTFTPTKKKK